MEKVKYMYIINPDITNENLKISDYVVSDEYTIEEIEDMSYPEDIYYAIESKCTNPTCDENGRCDCIRECEAPLIVGRVQYTGEKPSKNEILILFADIGIKPSNYKVLSLFADIVNKDLCYSYLDSIYIEVIK